MYCKAKVRRSLCIAPGHCVYLTGALLALISLALHVARVVRASDLAEAPPASPLSSGAVTCWAVDLHVLAPFVKYDHGIPDYHAGIAQCVCCRISRSCCDWARQLLHHAAVHPSLLLLALLMALRPPDRREHLGGWTAIVPAPTGRCDLKRELLRNLQHRQLLQRPPRYRTARWPFALELQLLLLPANT